MNKRKFIRIYRFIFFFEFSFRPPSARTYLSLMSFASNDCDTDILEVDEHKVKFN